MAVRYDNQVAIVTGAGAGLGRTHALGLAARGAKVVVNDLAGPDGVATAAEAVVAEIKAAGGEAIAHGANVADLDQVNDMVQTTMDTWGRIDILVNNAGILRDKTFAKMEMSDFELVVKVHLLGSANCTKAVWAIMREQNYGRIVMTTSSSGLYGNFGQSNYGAAKMGVVGLMNVLWKEGGKYNVKVNCLAPGAATAMTEGLYSQAVLDLQQPESVTAGLLVLCADEAPNATILCAGSGGFATTRIYETRGVYLKPEDQTPENVLANWDQIMDTEGQEEFEDGGMQPNKFIGWAAEDLGVDISEPS